MKEPIISPFPKRPKYIDVDYRTLPDIDSNPLFYDEDAQEILSYWTDGKKVYCFAGIHHRRSSGGCAAAVNCLVSLVGLIGVCDHERIPEAIY